MFARPRQKITAPPPRKKRKVSSAIEEIAFDISAREDYLTGFHKRKLQRIKQAKEEAAKRDREDKLAARKILREGRKADLEKHVEAVNSMLREQDDYISDAQEAETADGDQWEGIPEDPVVDHEDEYVDDDRFTSVTIEAVDVSKDGLHKLKQEDEVDSEDASGEKKSDGRRNNSASQGQEKPKRIWTKEQPTGPKKRKKNFRYESKAERKVTRYKEKSGNKASARARKER